MYMHACVRLCVCARGVVKVGINKVSKQRLAEATRAKSKAFGIMRMVVLMLHAFASKQPNLLWR